MRHAWCFAVLVVGCGSGCAAAPAKPAAGPGQSANAAASATDDSTTSAPMTAAETYVIAEQNVEHERYPEAVALLGHTLQQLPPTADVAPLRHKLVLRLAYVQMLAFEQTHDRAFIDDAEVMLALYLAAHEASFGDTESANAERGDVYEILSTVEALAETSAEREASRPTEEPTPAEEDPELIRSEPIDTHAGEVATDEMTRHIRVRTSRLAALDDPHVRERLESRASLGRSGLVLTAGIAVRVRARPLVRLRGGLDNRGGRRARRLLNVARPALVACYEAAFARVAEPTVRLVAEVTVSADGTVSDASVSEGRLGDASGDACVTAALNRTRLVGEYASTARVRMPLLFFYGGGTTFAAQQPHVGADHELPPIDVFHGVRPPPPRAQLPMEYAEVPPKGKRKKRRRSTTRW